MDYRNYCEIDLSAIKSNLDNIKDIAGKDVKIMGIVKADAYGHGIIKVSEALIKNGIDYLGVATVEEGLQIRKKFNIPIIILGYIPYNQIKNAIINDITLTVYNTESAKDISKIAKKVQRHAKVHIKVDTGMNRLGFLYEESDKIIGLKDLENIRFEGIFTHLSSADSDKKYTEYQFDLFNKLCSKLKKIFAFQYIHCCNSSGIKNFKKMYLNMVRPGISLYGLSNTNSDSLKPSMCFKSQVIYIKRIPSGSKISYNGNFITKRESIIATIPVGYGDGYPRIMSNRMNVLINGSYAPIIGNICMDYLLVDVTDINPNLYDEVVLFGKQGDLEISVNEIAKKSDTINYEIICSIGKRVPRIYRD